jgi:hypothetical protein
MEVDAGVQERARAAVEKAAEAFPLKKRERTKKQALQWHDVDDAEPDVRACGCACGCLLECHSDREATVPSITIPLTTIIGQFALPLSIPPHACPPSTPPPSTRRSARRSRGRQGSGRQASPPHRPSAREPSRPSLSVSACVWHLWTRVFCGACLRLAPEKGWGRRGQCRCPATASLLCGPGSDGQPLRRCSCVQGCSACCRRRGGACAPWSS